MPGELARLLQQEERTIQPHEEPIEVVNLGTEEDKKEVKIGANLEESVKARLIALLREYVDIFAWSYEDILGLDQISSCTVCLSKRNVLLSSKNSEGLDLICLRRLKM